MSRRRGVAALFCVWSTCTGFSIWYVACHWEWSGHFSVGRTQTDLFLTFSFLQLALRESLAAGHRSRVQEHQYASTWSHQAAITISHEIETFNILSHICQNFRNHAEMITSICNSPQVFKAMLSSFASANFSLSKGPATHSKSLYHLVHALPDEVVVEYPVILQHFAKCGHPLAAADLK